MLKDTKQKVALGVSIYFTLVRVSYLLFELYGKNFFATVIVNSPTADELEFYQAINRIRRYIYSLVSFDSVGLHDLVPIAILVALLVYAGLSTTVKTLMLVNSNLVVCIFLINLLAPEGIFALGNASLLFSELMIRMINCFIVAIIIYTVIYFLFKRKKRNNK